MAHEFRVEDAEILPVSVDSLESHRKWAEELGGVNYPLLSGWCRSAGGKGTLFGCRGLLKALNQEGLARAEL
jgi:peroxiredoxin